MEAPNEDIKKIPVEEAIQVVYDKKGNYLITLGDHGVQLDQNEAEQLFVDLGHALQDQDVVTKETKDE